MRDEKESSALASKNLSRKVTQKKESATVKEQRRVKLPQNN